MFYGPREEQTANVINIPDGIPADIFRVFLEYLYTDHVLLTNMNVYALMKAATKYCVSTLIRRCELFFKSNITSDNVCKSLETVKALGLKKLVAQCWIFILNTNSSFPNITINHLSCEDFGLIIESDDLDIEENQVLEVVLGWAGSQCYKKGLALSGINKRNVLGDVLFKVRFPLLDTKVFADLADTGLLTSEEQIEVFKSAARGNCTSEGKFSSKPRGTILNLCMVPNVVYNDSLPITFPFQCSEMTTIKGILCEFNDVGNPKVFKSKLIIYPRFAMDGQRFDTNHTYGNEVRKEQVCSVSTEIKKHKIMFPSTVCLEPNQYHLLYFTVAEPSGYQAGYRTSDICPPMQSMWCFNREVVAKNIRFNFYTMGNSSQINPGSRKPDLFNGRISLIIK